MDNLKPVGSESIPKNSKLEEISIFKSPIVTLRYFMLYVFSLSHKFKHFWKRYIYYWSFFGLIMILFFSLKWMNIKTAIIHIIEAEFYKIIKWVTLGILSSVGLGMGMHTFLLFLAPYIAEITTASYLYESPNFDVDENYAYGTNQIIESMSMLQIYKKVGWESFLWGAGTAIGELPPYFVAYASSKSAKVDEMAEISKKPANQRTWMETFNTLMFNMVKKFGFCGILLAASIPNPLFDLAGITCGYCKVPFSTFFTATFIGKAFFKTFLQTSFIIILFLETNMKLFLQQLHGISPFLSDKLVHILNAYKESLRKGHDLNSGPRSIFSYCWDMLIFVIFLFIILSLIETLARKQAELQEKKTQ